MKPRSIVAAAASGLALFLAGALVGMWLTTPEDPGAATADPETAAPSWWPFTKPEPPPSRTAARHPPRRGPFAFQFTAGESLPYQVNARITGQGLELLSPGGINLHMMSRFRMATGAVARDGTADLTLTFGDMHVEGGFMGAGYLLNRQDGQTRLVMGDRTYIDSARGIGSAKGIPQLTFFDEPIRLRVATNGEVKEIRGNRELEAMLAQLPIAADLEFPDPAMEPGHNWTTEFAMPIPGFDAPVQARIENTFTGYSQMDRRHCAVIQQRIASDAAANTATIPESALGDGMRFSLPHYNLQGEGTVYFDVERGVLLRNDLNLVLEMRIGEALGPTGAALEGLAAQLGGLLGGLPEFQGQFPARPNGGQGSLLDLKLAIDATLLLESLMPAFAEHLIPQTGSDPP